MRPLVIVLVLALAAMPSPTLAQASVHVTSAQTDLTIERVTGSRTAVMAGRRAPLTDVDVFEPLCLVPCDVVLTTGAYQFAVAPRGGHPRRVGDPILIRADAALDLTYVDRQSFRIAGWVLWIGAIVAGVGLVIGGALDHYDSGTVASGLLVGTLGQIPGIALSFLEDESSIAVQPAPEPVVRREVTTSADATVANEAVAACPEIGGATLRISIAPNGVVLRSDVTHATAEAARCARTALTAAEFPAGDARQAHVDIEASGPRAGDPATLHAAVSACPTLPPGSGLAVVVRPDGSVSEARVTNADETTTECVEASLRRSRFLPRTREIEIHVDVPAEGVPAPSAIAIPPAPGAVEAAVRALVELHRAAISACSEGAVVAVVAEWTAGGAVSMHLDGALRGTAADGCIVAATAGAALDSPPGQAGSLLHAVQ